MSSIALIKTWALNERLTSSDLNGWMSEIRTKVNTYVPFKDATATISAVWTFSATPIINAPLTVEALTVTTGGLTVTGASTITGQLNQVGTLAVTGSGSISGTWAVAGLFTAQAAAVVTTTLSVGGATALTGHLTGSTATLSGGVIAGSFQGIGTNLTALTAANITAGGTLPALNGAAVTALNGSNISSGTIDQARIATALGTRTFADVSTTVLAAGNTAISGTLGVSGVATFSEPLSFSLAGSTDTLSAFEMASDQAMSTTPGTGITRYLRVSVGATVFKIPMQAD